MMPEVLTAFEPLPVENEYFRLGELQSTAIHCIARARETMQADHEPNARRLW